MVALASGPHIPRLVLPAGRIAPRQTTAHLALAALFAGCAAVVIVASSGPFMMVASMAAIAFLLSGHDRSAGDATRPPSRSSSPLL